MRSAAEAISGLTTHRLAPTTDRQLLALLRARNTLGPSVFPESFQSRLPAYDSGPTSFVFAAELLALRLRGADARGAFELGQSAMFESRFVVERAGDRSIRMRFSQELSRLRPLVSRSWVGISDQIGSDSALAGVLADAERSRSLAFEMTRRDSLAIGLREFWYDRLFHTSLLAQRFPTFGRWYGDEPMLGLESLSLAASSHEVRPAIVQFVGLGDSIAVTVQTDSARHAVIIPEVSMDSIAEWSRMLRDAVGAEGGSRGIVIEGANRPKWQDVIGRLARAILPPRVRTALAGSNMLFIVADGELARVPWSALPFGDSLLVGDLMATALVPSFRLAEVLTERGRATTWPAIVLPKMQPFLLGADSSRQSARWAGERAAAVNAIRQWQDLRGQHAGKNALVIGDPSMPTMHPLIGSLRLPALPASQREAHAVARQLGTTATIGALATEDLWRRRAPDAMIIHVATHALAFDSLDQSGLSFLALSPGRGHDGILSSAELLSPAHRSLRANLVVLSACKTGGGAVMESEGVIGLARAFLERGAASVLATQWNVPDAGTASLMTSFYRHWFGDTDVPSKAEALRRAQVELRSAGGRLADPVSWAGVQLIGSIW